MPNTHHRAVRAGSGDSKRARHARRLDEERVVAGNGQGGGQSTEDAVTVMIDLGRLAVHELRCANDLGSIHVPDRLMAETDAEHRDPPLTEDGDGLADDPGVLGSTRAGRDQHRVGAEGEGLVDRDLIVPDGHRLGAELTQVLDEVVDEGVV